MGIAVSGVRVVFIVIAVCGVKTRSANSKYKITREINKLHIMMQTSSNQRKRQLFCRPLRLARSQKRRLLPSILFDINGGILKRARIRLSSYLFSSYTLYTRLR